MRFEETKSDTLNLRVSPSFKMALKAAAEHDRRSMVNMLEVLVASYCELHEISPVVNSSQNLVAKETRKKVAP